MVSFRVLTFLSALASLAATSPTAADSRRPSLRQKFKHFIAFGDSYTYVQGTHGYPKYSFIGSYIPDQFAFTAEELLENKISQNYTSQSAGGPNWIEHLTGCAVKDGLHSPLECDIQLWDFAVAGANTAEALLPLHHAYTTPLVNQTQQYLTYADKALQEHAGLEQSKTLVTIWIGINDIIDAQLKNLTSRDFYSANIETAISQAVTPLVDAGYENFLLLNLPPLERSPLNRDTFDGSLSGELIETWNSQLRNKIKNFGRRHKNIEISVFDANNLLRHVLEAPEHYGISETADYCKGSKIWPDVIEDPESFGCEFPVAEYFWFDGAHIGTRVHKALAEGVRNWLQRGI